jgi:uncharacterized Zn-finger protein
MRLWRIVCVLAALPLLACGSDGDEATDATSGATGPGSGGATSSASGGTTSSGMGGSSAGGADATTSSGSGGAGGVADNWPVVVVTYNTGTTDSLAHDLDTSDGYTSTEAAISNDYYGDGLAWKPAMVAAQAWFANLKPDIVVFQEIFYSGECPNIPSQYHAGWACEGWVMGDPTVAEIVLGTDYQIACNQGKPDKCAAVRKAFGSFQGCNGDLCLDGLDGATITGCGGGSRIGRGIIDLTSGGTMTVVNVHGTSGVSGEDMDCRKDQVEQVFQDLDGQPAANGSTNIVMGDFNTDPGRNALFDKSARRWNDFVGGNNSFSFITDVGFSATPTYASSFNIDHVVSDVLQGSCWTAGISNGHPDVFVPVYFDHKPAVCELSP